MFNDLSGRAAFVTGGSSGIGAAVAIALAREGCTIALHYNSNEGGAEATGETIRLAGGKVTLIRGNLAKSAEAERCVAEAAAALGAIDVLINNAGAMVARATLAEIDDTTYEAIGDVNVRSAVMVAKAALPHLRRSSAGVIINTTSVAARHGGGPGAGLYAAAKASLSSLTRNWAKELASSNIRVNAVSPGVIETPFHHLTSAELMETMRKSVPMGRVGSPEDCVGAYLFLASPLLSGYITGQIIEVNGGQFMP